MTEHVHISLTPRHGPSLTCLAKETGRNADELVDDAVSGYLDEVAQLREVLASRYDDLKSGRVKAIEGDAALAQMREKTRLRRSHRQE